MRINKLAVIPAIVGRLKEHQIGIPIRPVVTKFSSPTYTEKAFVVLLKNSLPSSDHVINSTYEFIQYFNNIISPQNYLTASLGVVVSLYLSIDTPKAV